MKFNRFKLYSLLSVSILLTACGDPVSKYFTSSEESIYPEDQVDFINTVLSYREVVLSKLGVDKEMDEAALSFYEVYRGKIPSLISPELKANSIFYTRAMTHQFLSPNYNHYVERPRFDPTISVSKWRCIYKGNEICYVFIQPGDRFGDNYAQIINLTQAERHQYERETDFKGAYPGDIVEFDGELSYFTYSIYGQDLIKSLSFDSISNIKFVAAEDKLEFQRGSGSSNVSKILKVID